MASGVERESATPVQRIRTTLAAWQLATLCVVVGILLMYLAASLQGHDERSPLEAVIENLGALLVVTGALSVMWDLVGRRALTDEVLEAADLSAQIRGARLTQVAGGYLDVPWNAHLASASCVDLFFTYAATWRAAHDTALRELVARKGTTVRVVLPNPDNERLIAELAHKFQLSANELRGRVARATSELLTLGGGAHERSSFELRHTDEFPMFTWYRFDKKAITVMYAQAPGRTPTPTLAYEDSGTLFEFFRRQFDELWQLASVPAGAAP